MFLKQTEQKLFLKQEFKGCTKGMCKCVWLLIAAFGIFDLPTEGAFSL